jgi:macrolide transport system ATP-binding/permease protein
MTSFFRKFKWSMRRPDKEAELQEELQFHLEEEAAERQAQGLADAEARRAARRELGNVALVQEDTRATWT